jgi:hypothetical protein
MKTHKNENGKHYKNAHVSIEEELLLKHKKSHKGNFWISCWDL